MNDYEHRSGGRQVGKSRYLRKKAQEMADQGHRVLLVLVDGQQVIEPREQAIEEALLEIERLSK